MIRARCSVLTPLLILTNMLEQLGSANHNGEYATRLSSDLDVASRDAVPAST